MVVVVIGGWNVHEDNSKGKIKRKQQVRPMSRGGK
jgi:hypothetical protein